MKNKKIIYIINDISIIGGREKIVLDKANSLSESEYDVTILSYNLKDKNIIKNYPTIKFESLELEDFNQNRKMNLFKRKIYFRVYLKKLKKILQLKIDELNPNIMICLCDIGLGEYTKIKTLAKKIIEIHGCYDYYIDKVKESKNMSKLKSFKKKIDFNRFKFKLKKFDKVVILSDVDIDKWGFKSVEVIPNFYDSKNQEKIKVKEKFEEKKFLSAGRLSYEKGYDILIDVWKEVVKINKNIKIDIYGEGPEEEKIKVLIKLNNLENNIKLKPFTNKLNEKYKDYYCYILPSRFEAFAMVVLESISNGVPVIGFDMESGLKDMITDGKEGYLIKKYEVKKMAEKIIKLYENEDLRIEISNRALDKSSSFTKEKIIKKWIELFENI
ncbi:MAG: glycosyltransferase [Clostridium sp.]|uniref:glycosyltransferase n=1 Tax=Clostridium sp. TaxID=1506 RepID=UPI003EE4F677